MRMALPLLMLTACQTVVIEPAQEFCSDYDPDLTEDDAEVFIEDDDTVVTVYRQPVYRGRQDVLDLQVSVEGRYVLIRESWTEEDAGSDICWQPTVDIVDPAPGDWTIEWYFDDDVKPTYTLDHVH